LSSTAALLELPLCVEMAILQGRVSKIHTLRRFSSPEILEELRSRPQDSHRLCLPNPMAQ
jgi:hypothetical protein